MADEKNKPMHENFAIYKPVSKVKIKEMPADARKKAQIVTMTLREFITGEYPYPEAVETKTPTKRTFFRCTIADIGLAPFQIDIYDNRMLLVELTGKMIKDADGNLTPFRRYVSRNYSMSTCLDSIATIMAKRKINNMDSTVLTLRDYHDAYAGFYRYVAKVVHGDYAKALDKLQENFPFTKISVDEDDEENWFKGDKK